MLNYDYKHSKALAKSETNVLFVNSIIPRNKNRFLSYIYLRFKNRFGNFLSSKIE